VANKAGVIAGIPAWHSEVAKPALYYAANFLQRGMEEVAFFEWKNGIPAAPGAKTYNGSAFQVAHSEVCAVPVPPGIGHAEDWT